jgi:mannose-6-phosphate isomerase-like protein (cupin superfamily)
VITFLRAAKLPGVLRIDARGGEMLDKVNLAEKLSQITDHWKPRILCELNGQELKLVKVRGTFVWHRHENEDELLLCLSGRFRIQFRDRSFEIEDGEFCVVPKGIEHRTSADDEAHLLVFEPIGTRNTGNVEDSAFTAVDVPI